MAGAGFEFAGEGIFQRNAPAGTGAFSYAHRKEVMAMKQKKLTVSIRIDDRFLTAAVLGLAVVVIVLLLLKK